MFKSKSDDFYKGLGLMIYAGAMLVLWTIYLCGIYHAFCASTILGFASCLIGGPTIFIEFVDWFSNKELWEEIAKLLGV